MIKKFLILKICLFLYSNSKIFELKNINLDPATQKFIQECWKKISYTESILFDETFKKIIVFCKDKEKLSIFQEIINGLDYPKKQIHLKIITGRVRNQTQNFASFLPSINTLQNTFIYGLNWFGIYNRNKTSSNFTFQGIGSILSSFPTPTVPIDPVYGNLFVDPNQFNLNTTQFGDIFTLFASGNLPAVILGFTYGANMSASRLTNVLYLEDSNLIFKSSRPVDLLTTDNKEITYSGQNGFPIYTLRNTQDSKKQIYQTWGIEYKNYGISLTLKPRIADKKTIVLTIFFERLNLDNVPLPLDPETAIMPLAPMFGVYRIRETIIIKEGESVLISSALNSNKNASFGKVSFLCRIPIIGKLFTSEVENTFDDDEFIVITPRILD